MENSIAVANYFVNKANDEGIELTPMKLLKLVYIAHGWHLGLRDEPLIDEGVQAWRYGPVVPSVYQYFKQYNNQQVSQLATVYTFTDGLGVVTPLVEGAAETSFLDKVWNVYKKYNGLQLSTLTHQPNTPWDIVYNKENGKQREGAIIPNKYIKEHYKLKAKNTTAIA